jgi:hypothetical protein
MGEVIAQGRSAMQKFNVSFKVGPFSSLQQWEGEAENPKEAMSKGLAWAEKESSLGIKASAVTQVLVVWEQNGKQGFEIFNLQGNGSTTPMDESAQAKPAKPKDPKWPFKHLKKKSSWPMQGMVLNMAAAVLSAPAPARKQAAGKMIERCFRMGARLALEFGMDPAKAMQLAQKQIEREIPGANQAIADWKISEHDEVSKLADEVLSTANLFGATKPKGEA